MNFQLANLFENNLTEVCETLSQFFRD